MSEIDTKISHRLSQWEQTEGQLPQVLQLYRELLQIQSEAKSHIVVGNPSLPKEVVRDRLCQGTPLLAFSGFSPDWAQVQKLFEQIVVWTTRDAVDSPADSERLRSICQDLPLLKKVAEAWYQGESITRVTGAEDVDKELLSSAIGATLKPFLSAYASVLLPEVDQELWRRRYCPICGGKPDFAYLDKERGARWLLCSRCDAEWLFLRLECPYCGTQNQNDLAYFTDDVESDLYRLYVCEQCRTYIKAVDLRHAVSEILLPLERMVTLDMDRQGQEKGYKPGCTDLTASSDARELP